MKTEYQGIDDAHARIVDQAIQTPAFSHILVCVVNVGRFECRPAPVHLKRATRIQEDSQRMRKLELSEWAALGEVIGTVAVFVSLLFVVYSINQNTNALHRFY